MIAQIFALLFILIIVALVAIGYLYNTNNLPSDISYKIKSIINIINSTSPNSSDNSNYYSYNYNNNKSNNYSFNNSQNYNSQNYNSN
jgi:lipopolysaccharide export LptBFGC system permease protein LptF